MQIYNNEKKTRKEETVLAIQIFVFFFYIFIWIQILQCHHHHLTHLSCMRIETWHLPVSDKHVVVGHFRSPYCDPCKRQTWDRRCRDQQSLERNLLVVCPSSFCMVEETNFFVILLNFFFSREQKTGVYLLNIWHKSFKVRLCFAIESNATRRIHFIEFHFSGTFTMERIKLEIIL